MFSIFQHKIEILQIGLLVVISIGIKFYFQLKFIYF